MLRGVYPLESFQSHIGDANMPVNEISQKAEYFDRAIQERHNIEGLVLPTLVLPPIGRETN
jgi:hypothetical protein